ncbi:MAG: LapA family protein [Pseudonocardia sp.]
MTTPDAPKAGFRFTPRMIAGLALVVLVVVFVALNRDPTRVSFILFTAETALWVALTLAGLAGFVAGWLVGRGRQR